MATLDHAMQDAHYEDDTDTLREPPLLEPPDFTSFEFDNSTATPAPSTIPATPTELKLIPALDVTLGSTSSPSSSSNTIWHQRPSSRRSWIWKYGNTILIGHKKYWECKLCRNNPKKYVEGSTKHPIDHLKLSHRMTAKGLLDPNAANGTTLIRQAFGTNTPKLQFNSDIFKQLMVQWMVECHVSFRQVEEPSFRLLMSYLAAITASYTSIPNCLPCSGNTIRSWTMQMFSHQKTIFISRSKQTHVVHFSFDMWSSGNQLSLLGVVAHWIDADSQACRALLGLRRLSGAILGKTKDKSSFRSCKSLS